MSLRSIALGAALVSAVMLGACDASFYDFRVFDDLKDETWVDSSGAPDGLDSQVYGVAIAGGAVASGNGASFFVAARNIDGFANLTFDAAGARAQTTLRLDDINNTPALNPMPNAPIMVSDSDAARAAVALSAGGTPEAPEQTVIALLDASNGGALESPRIALAGAELADGLAFGATTVAGGVKNVIALRGTRLDVVLDVDNPDAGSVTCAHGGLDGLGVVAGLIIAGNAMDQIAFAVPAADGNGEVHIIHGALVSDADATGGTPAPCFEVGREPIITLAAPTGAGPSFGSAMVIGDFNGQGTADLAVAAPDANQVFVYLDLDPVTTPDPAPIAIAAPDGAQDFGATLAAGNLDGANQDELVIGAPGTNADGTDNAGSAFLYTFSGQSFGEPLVGLRDAQPETGQQFGQSLAIVPFGSSQSILVVGSDQEVFTYFRTLVVADDVRTGR